MVLGGGEFVLADSLVDAHRGESICYRRCITQRIGVEADPISDLVDTRFARQPSGGPVGEQAAVTECHGDGVAILSRQQEGWHLQFLAGDGEGQQITILHPQLPGVHRRDQCCVIPRHLGDRIGKFLQPAIVGISSIEEGMVRQEHQFLAAHRLDRRLQGLPPASDHLRGNIYSIGSSLDESIVEPLLPRLLEIGTTQWFQDSSNDVVSRERFLVENRTEHFQRTSSRIERHDEGLPQGHRSIPATALTPLLEEVSLIEVPLTRLGGLVLVESDMN